jgi:hypothetical protein
MTIFLHYLLVFTSAVFILLALFLDDMPLPLKILISINSIASILFWLDPLQNRNRAIHTIDAALMRINIFLFICYKLWIYETRGGSKNLGLFMANTMAMFLFFWLSNIYSTHEWLSQSHIICHFFAHLFGMHSIYLAVENN